MICDKKQIKIEKFYILWVLSSFVFYVVSLILFFIYDERLYPQIKSMEIILLLACGLSLFISAFAFHPSYKKVLLVANKMFLIEFIFRYLFFVSIIFAKFFGLIVVLYVMAGLCVVIELLSKISIIQRCNLKEEKYFNISKNQEESFSEVFKSKMARNITQIITIIVFAILVSSDIKIYDWLLCTIAFLIIPLFWGIAEIIDWKIQKIRQRNILNS